MAQPLAASLEEAGLGPWPSPFCTPWVYHPVYASLPPTLGIPLCICLPASLGVHHPGIPPCVHHPWVHPVYTTLYGSTWHTLSVCQVSSDEALGSVREISLGEATSPRSGAKKCVRSYARARRITRVRRAWIG